MEKVEQGSQTNILMTCKSGCKEGLQKCVIMWKCMSVKDRVAECLCLGRKIVKPIYLNLKTFRLFSKAQKLTS